MLQTSDSSTLNVLDFLLRERALHLQSFSSNFVLPWAKVTFLFQEKILTQEFPVKRI